jgi:hypothetical protein
MNGPVPGACSRRSVRSNKLSLRANSGIAQYSVEIPKYDRGTVIIGARRLTVTVT